MKEYFIVSIALLILINASKAQNVGIGTNSPKEKLEVHNPVNSAIQISSANYNDTSRLIFSNRDNANSGTDFLLSAIQEQGLLISTRSDLGSNNNDSLLVLKTSGRLGIGVKSPATKLDVNGGARLAGFNTLEFGGGVTGKENNAGKIGYRTFTADALDIVGAGSSTTDRKVHIYAEGGTTLSGPINTLGALQINGNSGIAGQVLSSNGTDAPSWVNTAYSNNDRFGVSLSIAFATTQNNGFLTVDTILYNQNSSAISIGSSAIVILKSGLYHFSGSYNFTDTITQILSENPVGSLSLTFTGNFNHKLVLENLTPLHGILGIPYWAFANHLSQDIYITAPTTLRIHSYLVSADFEDKSVMYMSLFANRVSD